MGTRAEHRSQLNEAEALRNGGKQTKAPAVSKRDTQQVSSEVLHDTMNEPLGRRDKMSTFHVAVFSLHTTDVHVWCLVEVVLDDSPFTEPQARAKSAIQQFIHHGCGAFRLRIRGSEARFRRNQVLGKHG